MQLYTRSAGGGLPVVLLHAFPLSSAMWLAQREGLSAVCKVITPDLRGFGGSALGDDEPSVDVMADDVVRLLDREGVDRAVVGGLSMGGYVTMALCRRHPDRVRGVILADTKAEADPEAARANRERIAAAVLDSGTSVLVDEVLPALVGRTTAQRRAMVFGRVRGLVQSAPPGAVAWAQRAMAARPDSFDTLRGLKVPVLVIVGEEDELTPPAVAEAMVEAVPDGRLAVIGKAGHLSAVEQPEAFNRAVSGFIAELAAGSPPHG
ncbi:pimeloyl-ACP methyl ester carboxylesterase [Streptosporangium becharense]|uniref:Pimeloyl-ACP methyl ester carboxylesterase n=1 Tax=Streptosporangium becharense TaxID=1816182 RepID=A0A7W9MG21_9ACTN|nr:alpha/beta fold hydrolase [Streptosporangium becharense]MBB2909959.1 pimeloyl-ACP methyl ester carboxylesterase [Streptosporangium becharense]MBB5819086.1 pimeloyl-ACP methyl ester carboxylesterase [Streptosporangium becharense]